MPSSSKVIITAFFFASRTLSFTASKTMTDPRDHLSKLPNLTLRSNSWSNTPRRNECANMYDGSVFRLSSKNDQQLCEWWFLLFSLALASKRREDFQQHQLLQRKDGQEHNTIIAVSVADYKRLPAQEMQLGLKQSKHIPAIVKSRLVIQIITVNSIV